MHERGDLSLLRIASTTPARSHVTHQVLAFAVYIATTTYLGAAVLQAGLCMISGTAINNRVISAWLIASALAASNLTLGAAWATCIDPGRTHAGVVSTCMNTFGQIGGVLRPIFLAFILGHLSSWAAPLYLSGVLYLFGGTCWWLVNPAKPLLED